MTALVALGVGAQWISWKIHQPSILLLLLIGILAGPVFGWLQPDRIFGQSLFPIISLSVAVILFEGGMSLRVRDLRERLGNPILRLLTVGVFLTLFLISVAGRYILDLETPMAILLGAILTVTGPTVIVPLLRSFEMDDRLRSILKWEGIVVDPIGAFLSVIAFELVLAGRVDFETVQTIALPAIIKTLLAGIGIGFIVAVLLLFLMKKDWIPEFLHNPVVLVWVILSFTLSNMVQPESGLLAVTVMGFTLANQKYFEVSHVLVFKENLRVLLTAVLFILLSSRIRLQSVAGIGWHTLTFLGVLIFGIRPFSVFLSTMGSSIPWRFRAFLAFMAPRGIVAASVASVFSLELISQGNESGRMVVATVFFIIIGTVLFYGVIARPMAKLLRLSLPDPRGVLMVGGHPWAREIASALKEKGIYVVMVDSNANNVLACRMAGLAAFQSNILDDSIADELDLSGIGYLVALTSNDEINSLAALKYRASYGRNHVFQLSQQSQKLNPRFSSDGASVPREMRGNTLFHGSLTFDRVEEICQNGGQIRVTGLTEEFNYSRYLSYYNNEVYPLFLIGKNREIHVFAENQKLSPVAGDSIIGLVLQQEKGEEK